jgi:cytochrome b561
MSDEQLLPYRHGPIPQAIACKDDYPASRRAPASYSRVAILMHWVMAFFILLNLSVGFFMETFANPSPQRNSVLFYHASIGVLIFALAVFRLGWRLTHQPPPLPQSISKAQQTAAHGLHWVLYGLIFLQPISGCVHRMAGAHPVSVFGLFYLPVLIAKNEPLRLFTDVVHDGGAIIIAILVAGHIGMALKHRFMDRDGVMQRMTR